MPSIPCPCGPGQWVRLDPEITCDPASPTASHDGGGNILAFKTAKALPDRAEVSLQAFGRSGFFNPTGAYAGGVSAMFSFVQSEIWDGPVPACPRMVSITATGGTSQLVQTTTTARPGCNASASSSVSGSCSSLGDASADFDNTIEASATLFAMIGIVNLAGNIGAQIDFDSATVSGMFSSLDSWQVIGTGSATGTAALSVKSNRKYCAFTNKPVTRRASGTATVAGGAAVGNGGSSSFSAMAVVQLAVGG
ncbi:MAG: hypothetical protein KF724_08750 [Phycisphaeraceae bacterium]|nr:hypothetical protein [Phycisphaeraceae bacterium]